MEKLTEQLLKERKPVHDKCLGVGFTDEEKEILSKHGKCSKMVEADIQPEDGELFFCSAYVNPANWWRNEGSWCPLCDHYRPDLVVKQVSRGRVGQQKQKKRK